MTRHIEEVVELVVQALDEAGVEYAVSGALASAFHGYARATQDLDIQVRIEQPEGLEPIHALMPEGTRRIDHLTWRLDDRWEVEFYPTSSQLEQRAMETRVEGQIFEGVETTYAIVALEPLLVLKVREHLKYPYDLKHIDDIRKLLARNADRLDVEELERLLALDPEWGEAWDELVEPG